MRTPLAVKVMFAFVAVILAGALPIRVGLRETLRRASTDTRAAELQARAALVADQLYAVPPEELPAQVRRLTGVLTERVTLINMQGDVLYDSNIVRHLESHLMRPEVVAALDNGAGVAERVSTSDGVRYLYCAVPIRGPQGNRAILRLAAPQIPSDRMTESVVTLVERSTAVSISLALLLSFVAGLAIVRPLRKMRDGATRMAAGELTLTLEVNTRDELADLARALEAVGAQLRARLATSGSGEALLGQILHAMAQGVVVLNAEGEVRHVNGVARARLGLRGPRESERLTRLLESKVVIDAMKEATRDPLGVDIRVPHPVSGEPLDGVVVALRRAEGPPLHALVLDVQPEDATSLPDLPELDEVITVPLRELMDRAMAQIRDELEEANFSFAAPDEWPANTLVDAGGRVEGAVAETLRAAARGAGNQSSTPLTASVHGQLVCLRLPVSVPAELVATLQPRLSPLGGRVECGTNGVELWLPLA